ncbi:MAG: hypothetical protein CMH47_15375 [Muricauda sp.]|nr:hypothetical protein [Allomuricauda sp.]
MDKNDLQVVLLTKKELLKYLESPNDQRKYPLPFSQNKAQWLLDKPELDENDCLAVMAVSGGKLLSFAHLVPDFLSSPDQDTGTKIYWIVQWWAAPSAKSTVISTYVFSEALRLSNNMVLTKAYEENADTFYKKQPFSVIGTMERHTIFIGVAKDMVNQKLRLPKWLSPITRWVESISMKYYNAINSSRVNTLTKDLDLRYMNQLDVEAWNFIEPYLQSDLVAKNLAQINWQLDPRQYVSKPWNHGKTDDSKIRGFAERIGIVNFLVYRYGKAIGFVSFHYIHSTAYMKYCIANDADMPGVCACLYKNLYKLNISYMFTDNQTLAEHLTKTLSVFYHYRQTKKSMAHNTLHKELQVSQLAEQDGHFI